MKKQIDIMDSLRAVETTDQPTICAIDPGSTGGVILLATKAGHVLFKSYVPTQKEGLYHMVDFLVMTEVLSYIQSNFNCSFIIEKVSTIQGGALGKIQNWNFSYAVATLNAAFLCCGITPYKATPKEWQSSMWSGVGKVMLKGKGGVPYHDTKATSLKAKERMYPHADCTPTERSKKSDHNLVDALLIAMYLTRINNH